MKDPQTLVHKGYGFVSFVNKVDAESAIAQMNGQWLGNRKIRTNWATRKVQPGGIDGGLSEGNTNSGGVSGGNRGTSQKYGNKLDYNEVWVRASDTNATVYCGGINPISEDIIRSTFSLYGQIIGIHSFPDRGYAFIRFMTKEAACNAICGVHGMDVNGSIAKCSWGKENIDISGNSTHTGLSNIASSHYSNANTANPALVSNMPSNNNPWAAAAAASSVAPQNSASAWAAASYQWPTGYPQNTMNYWQAYPADAAAYQNAMAMQGWGIMSAASNGNTAPVATPQYNSMGQYQQNTNGKQ
jgi:nucleolysin TIA-1/TIAR